MTLARTSQLSIYVEASDVNSYPGTGTIWGDLHDGGLGFRNGTLTNGPVFTTSRSGSFTFDGVDDFVQFSGSNDDALLTGTVREFHVWLRWTGTGTQGILSKQSNANSGRGWVFYVTNGKLRFTYRNVAGTYSVETTAAPLSDGQWHMVSFTATLSSASDAIRFWSDGVLLNSFAAPNTGSFSADSTPLRLGDNHHDGADGFSNFQGQIGEFFSYRNAPTTAQVLANYNETRARYLVADVININRNALPATATGLFTDEIVSTTREPNFQATPATATSQLTVATIITVNPDTTQITTSVLVSALLRAPVVIARRNRTFNAGVATASAQFQEHTIVTGTGVSFDAATSIGHTALMVNPERVGQDGVDYPAQRFNASATSGTHATSIPPNYRNLVKRNDPVFYISTHVGRVTPVQDGRFAWPGHSPAATHLEPQTSPGTFVSIGDGLSWTVLPGAISDGSTTRFTYSDTTSRSFLNTLYGPSATMNHTIEQWRQSSVNDNSNLGPDDAPLFASPGLNISSSEITVYPIEDVYNVSYFQSIVEVYINASPTDITLTYLIPPAARSRAETFFPDTKMHHIVFRIEDLPSGGIRTAFFYDGIPIGPTNGAGWTETAVSPVFPNVTSWGPYSQNSFGHKMDIPASGLVGERFDEVAIYDKALSNSEIFDHFSFVDSINPDRDIDANTFEAFATSPTATIFSVQNRNIPGDTLYSSATIPLPSVVAARTINVNAQVISGTQADAVDPFFFGDPDFISRPAPAVALAEFAPNVLRIDENYALYILEEFEPHRYVRFDAPEPNLDSGSDTKYGAAAPFVYNGQVTLPINGINNNSLMSDGIDYTTNGLIVKESEWNDDWGTSGNHYHTSFWIKRDISDTPSTTGLRIFMSAYGPATGSYVIMYQYQDRLHLETFDGITRRESATTNILNLLDYNRHNLVLEFNHSGGGNHTAKVYVDGALQITQNIGTSKIILTNSTTALAPNTETNNFPRAAVGALIAPYANTSLPLIPTATKMLIDEFYWSKMAITAGQVQDLYEAMPFKVNLNFNADFFLLQNAATVDPTVQTGTTSEAVVMIANTEEVVNPVVYTEIELVFNAQPLEANAEGIDPFSVIGDDVREIDFNVGESLMAYADMGEATVAITIPFPTMYASARAVNSTPYFDPYHLLIVQQSRLPLSTSFAGRWGIGDID